MISYTTAMEKSSLYLQTAQTIGEAIECVSAALENADVYFGHGTDNPWDEAAQLVLSVVKLPLDSDPAVLPGALATTERSEIDRLLQRRIDEQVPLPYLLGTAWFAGLEFACDQRAIIPRSPIAELILHGFQPWYTGPAPQHVLDLCCGGGCIGLSMASHYHNVNVDLVDLDASALELARENAILLRTTDRVAIYESDLYSSLPAGRKYDLIVSNPPYVDKEDLASMPAEYQHEPAMALGSGDDGLDITHKILTNAGPLLKDDGLLVIEVGNSWPALEAAYPLVPFTWVEFEHGGDGVFVLSAQEWQDYSASWHR